jgi:hypothetical protein
MAYCLTEILLLLCAFHERLRGVTAIDGPPSLYNIKNVGQRNIFVKPYGIDTHENLIMAQLVNNILGPASPLPCPRSTLP